MSWLNYITDTSRNKHQVQYLKYTSEYILKLQIHQHSLLTRKVFFRHNFQHWSSCLYQLDYLIIYISGLLESSIHLFFKSSSSSSHLRLQVFFIFKSSSSSSLLPLQVFFITGSGSSLDLDHHCWIIITVSSSNMDHNLIYIITKSGSSSHLDHHLI